MNVAPVSEESHPELLLVRLTPEMMGRLEALAERWDVDIETAGAEVMEDGIYHREKHEELEDEMKFRLEMEAKGEGP